jgi:hypothetical protein
MDNKFYKEFDKLRLLDAASRTGYESDRQMAKRLGIHNKTITLYKRGAIPHPQTVQMIVKAGGYNTETFQRLMAAAAQRDGVVGVGESKIPVYKQSDIGSDGILETAVPLFFLSAPMELNVLVSRKSLVGIKLDEDDNSCEPRIPRGYTVIYSSEPCDEPEDNKFYVFADEIGATPAMMRVRRREIWRTGENLDDLVKISKKQFQETALGKVVMVQGFMINGVFE